MRKASSCPAPSHPQVIQRKQAKLPKKVVDLNFPPLPLPNRMEINHQIPSHYYYYYQNYERPPPSPHLHLHLRPLLSSPHLIPSKVQSLTFTTLPPPEITSFSQRTHTITNPFQVFYLGYVSPGCVLPRPRVFLPKFYEACTAAANLCVLYAKRRVTAKYCSQYIMIMSSLKC